MRWSERRTAVRCTFDFHTFTPSDARPRPPSLILFSLGLTHSAMDTAELNYEGAEARDWLRQLSGSLRPTWKFVDLRWMPETRQDMQDEAGQRQRYILPPRFLLTYYRTRFRFFGGVQSTTVEFAESDVDSVSFWRSRAIAFWEAYYCHLRI